MPGWALALAALAVPPASFAIDFATTIPWTAGKLSDFLDQHADAGYSSPLFKPAGIDASGEVAHLVDLAFQNHSVVVGSGGRLDLGIGGSITNFSDGTLSFVGLHHIVTVAGASEAGSITNEGLFSVSGPKTLEIGNVRLVNQNGGIISVFGHMFSFLSEINDGSRFEGTGIAEIGGRVTGAVFSEGSLNIVRETTGTNAVMSGDWWLPRALGAAKLLGTWTNEGTLHGGFQTQPATPEFGAIGPGATFTNNGTMVGSVLTLIGTTGFQPVSDRTHVINNGVMDLRGAANTVDSAFRDASGQDPVMFENHGTILADGGAVNFKLDNDGTISVAGSILAIYGDTHALSSRSGATFRNGTQLLASGPNGRIDLLDINVNQPSDFNFSGAVTLQQVVFRSKGLYQGDNALLGGNATWTTGTFAGTWTNLGTLSFSLSGALPPARVITGTFGNLGTLQWRDRLDLRSGAAVANIGTFAVLENDIAGNALHGEVGGAVETFTNIGRFTTRGTTTIDTLAFTNIGRLEVDTAGILSLDNMAFENAGIISSKGRIDIGANIAGGFKNSGRVEWNKEIRIQSGATVFNEGIYDMQPGIGGQTVLTGRTGAAKEIFVNNGRFLTTTSGRSFLQRVDFVNNGSLEIRDGGTLLVAPDSLLLNFGTIMGNGRLEIFGQSLINHGVIAPGLSPGTLTIAGGFENAADGVLELEIASADVFDVLQFEPGTTIKLGGTLRLKLLNGFVPTVGQAFTLLKFDAFTGAFDNVELLGFAGATFNLNYGPKQFGLSIASLPAAVPVPGAAVLLLGTLPFLVRRRTRSAAAA